MGRLVLNALPLYYEFPSYHRVLRSLDYSDLSRHTLKRSIWIYLRDSRSTNTLTWSDVVQMVRAYNLFLILAILRCTRLAANDGKVDARLCSITPFVQIGLGGQPGN